MKPESLALTGRRKRASQLVEGTAFVSFITGLILVNAVTLGLETDSEIVARYGQALFLIDKIILFIFTGELLVKFYAYRLSFFRSGWNVFDFAVVCIAWVPAQGPFAILRALRILRILRLISVVPQMRRVVTAIGHSIPGMISVIGVLSLIFYVAAVLATKLFGAHPDPDIQSWFGSVSASAYTLFQIMTLESWSMGIVRPTMDIFPWSWLFFLPFIIVTSFAVLNLFIGIIVDAMQTAHKLEAQENAQDDDAPLTQKDLRELVKRLEILQEDITRLKTAQAQQAVESRKTTGGQMQGTRPANKA